MVILGVFSWWLEKRMLVLSKLTNLNKDIMKKIAIPIIQIVPVAFKYILTNKRRPEARGGCR